MQPGTCNAYIVLVYHLTIPVSSNEERGSSARVGTSKVDLLYMTSMIDLSGAVADRLFPVAFATIAMYSIAMLKTPRLIDY
jgi:hypothetical protein